MNDLKINAQHIADLKNAMQQAIDDGEIAKVDAPLEHYFAAGLYGRRIFVPAGTTVVTKVHKVQHIAIALKGTCTVIDQDGKKSIVSAPSVFITEPGTQRAIFCHDDVEWITVHASESNWRSCKWRNGFWRCFCCCKNAAVHCALAG